MLSRLILGQPGNLARNGMIRLSLAEYHTTPKLQFSFQNLLKMGKMSSTKLKKKDGVPSDYQMIYRMGLESYIEPTKYIGFGASIFSVAVLPFMLINPEELVELSIGRLSFGGVWETWALWAFILNHAVGAYYVCYKVPIRMYFSEKEDNYIIVMNHPLPWKKILVTVEPGDVDSKLKQTDIFQMNRFRHMIVSKNRVMYISSNFFMNGFYYKKLLGINSEEYDDY